MRTIGLVAALALVTTLAACKTAEIPQSWTTPIPSGLTTEEAAIAIAGMLTNPGDAAENEKQTVFRFTPFGGRIFEQSLQAGMTSTGWFLEVWDDQLITAGFQHKLHYLRAVIRVDEASIVTAISDSKNLKQEGKTIHENALVWVDALQVDIRRMLGRAVALKKGAE